MGDPVPRTGVETLVEYAIDENRVRKRATAVDNLTRSFRPRRVLESSAVDYEPTALPGFHGKRFL